MFFPLVDDPWLDLTAVPRVPYPLLLGMRPAWTLGRPRLERSGNGFALTSYRPCGALQRAAGSLTGC